MEYNCTVSFTGEAHESAETVYTLLETWAVRVFPTEGPPFDAEVGPITIRPDDGFQICVFYVWDKEQGRGDREKPVPLSIYEDVDRIEVF
jgi:hypothetical protein